MISQALRWTLKSRGWERLTEPERTVYAGRLYQLHTEVVVDKTGRITKVSVELDSDD